MLRILVVFLWLCVMVGTFVTGNVAGNGIVCLVGLWLLVRARARKAQQTPADQPRHLPALAPISHSHMPRTPASGTRRWR